MAGAGPRMDSEVATEPTVDPTVGSGDHERFAHIVVPASAVTEAYITGAAVTALCGKTWVPSRDPKRYPVCPTCREILEHAGGSLA